MEREMNFRLLVFLFFIFSFLLLFISIMQNTERIYTQEIKSLKATKVQIISTKKYLRSRKVYIPERSYILAKREIENILLKEPIRFTINKSFTAMSSTLLKIVKVLNHLKEDVVLSILAHTDNRGTAQYNLKLSQKRADVLKKYFLERTNLPLIIAIGYGETFSFEQRIIEINLKRIKE